MLTSLVRERLKLVDQVLRCLTLTTCSILLVPNSEPCSNHQRDRAIGSVASNDDRNDQLARGEGFISYDGTSIAPDNSTHGLVGVPVDRAGNNVDLAHGHIIDASTIADSLNATFDSSDLALGLQPQGGNIPHNTMQPYLTTNYIVRLTSQQSASILEGVSLNFNLDNIVNTTNPVATANQIIRFDGTNFKVVHSNISGYYKTSNENLILNTSEGTDGATTEKNLYLSIETNQDTRRWRDGVLCRKDSRRKHTTRTQRCTFLVQVS